MNIALWIVQCVLAALFLFTGSNHAFKPWDQLTKSLPGIDAFPRGFIRFLGVCEIFGVLGLLVPGIVIQAFHGAGFPATLAPFLPWLTILAGIGFAIQMVGAFTLHLMRREYHIIAIPLALFVLTLFVSSGRFGLSPL